MRASLPSLRLLQRPPARTWLLAGLMVIALIIVVAGLSTMEQPGRVGLVGSADRNPGADTRFGAKQRDERVMRTDALPTTQESVAARAQGTVQRMPFPGERFDQGWGQRIVRQASIELELADVEQGVARLVALAESLGGFVASTDTQTDARGASRAMLMARVPAAEFARALSGIDGVGRVTRRAVAGQDVSEELVDLEARQRNLERHEAQLLGFMAKAQKVADLVSLENELTRVRGEIEQAAGRLRFLRGRADLATVQVSLMRAPLASPRDGQLARVAEQLKVAFAEGWLAALGWTLALAVLAAQLSPLAVPTLVGWAIYRRRVHRRSASGASA